jgi:hypothetical protein
VLYHNTTLMSLKISRKYLDDGDDFVDRGLAVWQRPGVIAVIVCGR